MVLVPTEYSVQNPNVKADLSRARSSIFLIFRRTGRRKYGTNYRVRAPLGSNHIEDSGYAATCGGRIAKDATMRSCSPRRYSVSTVSWARQTIRLGGSQYWRFFFCTRGERFTLSEAPAGTMMP